MPTAALGPEFSGTIIQGRPESLLVALERARRADARIMVNLTGPEEHIVNERGFDMAAWKQRVDRFRGIDFSSYVADGTLLAHYVMDEPYDASQWKGKPVTAEVIEELARYSKEIWPSLPAIVGAWAYYLKGYPHKYLDGVRIHYHVRYGPVEPYGATHLRDAKAAGLSFMTGLNVLNGGSGESRIPGRKQGKFAMGAREIRDWGNLLIADPYVCAFFLWEYDSEYLARPDIKDAVAELKKKAEAHAKQSCKR